MGPRLTAFLPADFSSAAGATGGSSQRSEERFVSRHVDSSSQRRHVVIIGGGLAGLSAAEALMRQFGDDFRVTLLEARRVTGGRAGSFTDPSTGQTVDYCQHVAMGCCTNLVGLLDRCGLADSMHRYQRLRFLHPEHPPSEFAPSKLLPAPLHLGPAFASLRYLNATQKRAIRRGLFRLMRQSGDSLRDQTAAQWLQSQGQDAETIRDFWDVVLVSALGEQTDVVSMSAARKVFVDGFAASRGASDVLVPKRSLAELFGEALPARLAELGVDLRTGTAVAKIVAGDGRLDAIHTVSGERLSGDHVIAAVPWHVFPDLADSLEQWSPRPLQRDAIASSPITGLHLWLDREITPWPHAVMVGTVAQWLFRQPFRPADPRAGHYYQVVISASGEQRAMGKDELVGEVLDELRHAFPPARSARLLGSRVVTDPHSVFSLSPEVDRVRPDARTALPWFHLAGDWIATGWPATMEGAVISGRLAAASVLESEGKSGIEVDPGLPRGWLAKLMIAR